MYDVWMKRWQGTLDACERLGGETYPLEIGDPATEEQVLLVEQELDRKLPTSLRQVALEFAAKVSFSWSFLDEFNPPYLLQGVGFGGIEWDLAYFTYVDKNRQGWVDACFSNPEDAYDRVWMNKLAFISASNGDCIAFDLDDPDHDDPPVVYLSHDGSQIHGYRLGHNFIDFINKWTQLGCPGPEDWSLEPFLESSTGTLLTDNEAARLWRDWLGLGE